MKPRLSVDPESEVPGELDKVRPSVDRMAIRFLVWSAAVGGLLWLNWKAWGWLFQ